MSPPVGLMRGVRWLGERATNGGISHAYWATVALLGAVITGSTVGGAIVLRTSGPFAADSAESKLEAQATTPPAVTPTGEHDAVVTTLDRATYAGGFNPGAVAVDATGVLYITDFDARKVYRLLPTGPLEVFAGSGKEGVSDGQAATAEFAGPGGIAIDKAGNVFVADSLAHRIRRIDPSGNVSTFAGGGDAGLCCGQFRDGQGADARFHLPAGLAFDRDGNLIVADKGNDRIRSIAPNGVVSTMAGNGTAGSVALQVPLKGPVGVAIDRDGTIYFTEHRGNSIRRITPTGKIETILSSVPAVVTGDSGSLSRGEGLAFPSGLAILADGSLLVADTQANRILQVVVGGASTMIAGNGSPGLANGKGQSAQFSSPVSFAILSSGEVVVADQGNRRLASLALK